MSSEVIYSTEVGLIKIEQSSPYGVPWKGSKKNRPKDYFDSIKTNISFTQGSNEIEIIVSGKSRKETINLLLNGKEIEFTDKNKILNLGETPTADIDRMYVLEKIIERPNLLDRNLNQKANKNETTHQVITPYVRRSAFEAEKKEVNKELSDIIMPYLDNFSTIDPPKRLIIPVIQKYDTNNPDFKHWYVCVVNFDKNGKLTAVIIESREAINRYTLSQLQAYYFQDIIVELNNCLNQQHLPSISENNIQYAQGKQYGLVGCGITASVNIQLLLNDPQYFDGKYFDYSDQELTVEKDKVINITDIGKKKSGTGDMIQDVLRRVELALSLYKREQINKEIPEPNLESYNKVMKQLQRNRRFFNFRAKNDIADIEAHKKTHNKK